MQGDRHVEGLFVIRATGVREPRRTEHKAMASFEKTVAFCRDAEQVGIELAIGVLIMNDRERKGSGRASYKVATRAVLPPRAVPPLSALSSS